MRMRIESRSAYARRPVRYLHACSYIQPNSEQEQQAHSLSQAIYTTRIRNTQYAPSHRQTRNTVCISGHIPFVHCRYAHTQYSYRIHSTQIGSRILCGPQIRNTQYANRVTAVSLPCAQYTFVSFNTQISIHCVNCIHQLSRLLLALAALSGFRFPVFSRTSTWAWGL